MKYLLSKINIKCQKKSLFLLLLILGNFNSLSINGATTSVAAGTGAGEDGWNYTVRTLDPIHRLPYTTVMIEADTASGTSSGTGFFYIHHDNVTPTLSFGDDVGPPRLDFDRCIDDRSTIRNASHSKLIVLTNNHVTRDDDGEDVDELNLSLNFLNTPSYRGHVVDSFRVLKRTITINRSEYGALLRRHGDADLCSLDINDKVKALEASERIKLLYYAYTLSTRGSVSSRDILSDIALVGYPRRFYDEAHNLPIIRGGKLSTSGAGEAGEYLIDCAVYNGSSGSPILRLIKSPDRDETMVQLIGILYSGPKRINEVDIKLVKEDSFCSWLFGCCTPRYSLRRKDGRAGASVPLTINLGKAIPVEKIDAILPPFSSVTAGGTA